MRNKGRFIKLRSVDGASDEIIDGTEGGKAIFERLLKAIQPSLKYLGKGEEAALGMAVGSSIEALLKETVKL